MLVQDIMHHPVVTADAGQSLAAAYRLMQEHEIRHLPVLSEGRLVGIVTERDLRFLTRQAEASTLQAEDRIEHVMTPHPVTASPLDPFEQAARLMHTRKIGSLPILDGDALVGIITLGDIVEAFLHLAGVNMPGARLVVVLEDTPGELARLTTLVAEHNVPVHSILSSLEGSPPILRIILRVGTLNPAPLAEALRRTGFTVEWPVAKM